uniref:ShKT domain-containing protein n=1 Tax=Parastrongyloides trichosuri TaxID=131310 RepID=A0A0N4ZDB6_PARTI
MILNFILLTNFLSLIETSIAPITGVTVFCWSQKDCPRFGKSKRCVRLQGKNYCIEPCDIANEVDQCGRRGICKETKDVHLKSVMICTDRMTCMDNNACHSVNPKKPKCNLHTLKCIADPKVLLTTVPTTLPTTTKKSTTKILETTTKHIRIKQTQTTKSFKFPHSTHYYRSRRTTSGTRFNYTVKPCTNRVDGGGFDCLAHISYCYNDQWNGIMKYRCPKTCQFCTTNYNIQNRYSSCRDYSSDCSNKQNLCRNRLFKNFMLKHCPLTCHYC